jgi:hypothetical protein
MADADDARVQLRDAIDIRQRAVLPVLASDDHFATASNHHLRAITELDRAHHTSVKLGEGLPGAGHVVAGARVQVPPLLHATAHSSKVDLGARLVEVDGI